MKKSDVLKRDISDLCDRAEELVNRAEREGREMSAAEHSEWDGIMNKSSGSLATKEAALTLALDKENGEQRLRATRALTDTPHPVYSSNGGAYRGDDVRVVAPNLTCFRGENGLRDAYDAGLLIKAFAGDRDAREKVASRRGNTWLATLNETTPTDGGYLVPSEIVKQLTVYREQVGVSRKLCRVFNMNSDNLTFAKQDTGATCYYVGEEQSITDSSQTFSTVTLQPRKKACLTYLSSELDADGMVSVMDVAMTDLAHQLSLQEDKEFILGDGTSSYGGQTGVKTALTTATASLVSAATNNDLWSEITYADLAKAMAAVSDKYAGMPMSWLCSASFKYQCFDRLTLAQGGATSDSLTANGSTFFAGYPIVVSDRMPTTTAAATLCCIFGAFSNAVAIGDRGGIKLAVSPHVAFATDRLCLRATVRTHLVCHEVGDTVSSGAIIGFKTAS